MVPKPLDFMKQRAKKKKGFFLILRINVIELLRSKVHFVKNIKEHIPLKIIS